jgi:cell division protein FtsW (lipid II flippase)
MVDLIRSVVLFLTGFICLILAVFSSHWFFIPLIGIMTLDVLLVNRKSLARRARGAGDSGYTVLYDSHGNKVRIPKNWR